MSRFFYLKLWMTQQILMELKVFRPFQILAFMSKKIHSTFGFQLKMMMVLMWTNL
uniref:Uncharacterized protein n=1 Tax=Arundo donax TaxID=35708 RepID=A0A0A9K2W5_ARUDO